jgi:hypothetical protein
VCQAEYDQVASDFAANDPRALEVLVKDHGVKAIPQFPNSVVEAAAKASLEVLTSIRDKGDALTKKTAESFVKGLNTVRLKTEGTDEQFIAARAKYFKI